MPLFATCTIANAILALCAPPGALTFSSWVCAVPLRFDTLASSRPGWRAGILVFTAARCAACLSPGAMLAVLRACWPVTPQRWCAPCLAPNTKPDASLAGKLVLVEMPEVEWTGQVFHQRAVHVHDPEHAMGLDTPYARPFQMLGPFISLLDSLQAAGAAGVIVILDTPSLAADGLYAPCDGVVRQLPGVFIDRGRGQRLRDRVLAGTAPVLRLTMAATVRQVQTHNLVGIIPGKSDELMVLAK